LWPYIAGEKTNNREFVVSSYGYIAAVRTPEWNYSAVWNKEKFQGSYSPQLYDLKKDPEELHNVADQHPQVLVDLQAKLDQYVASGKDITNGSFSEQLA
jgi:arylsulfatase A-like enzyme